MRSRQPWRQSAATEADARAPACPVLHGRVSWRRRCAGFRQGVGGRQSFQGAPREGAGHPEGPRQVARGGAGWPAYDRAFSTSRATAHCRAASASSPAAALKSGTVAAARLPGSVRRQVLQPVPQQRGHGEFRFADHGLRVNGGETVRCRLSVRCRSARPGQDVEVVEVRMDQDVPPGAAAHRPAGLAHLQGRFQQPARKWPAQLLPVRGQVIAPLLGARGDVVEFPPLRPVVGKPGSTAGPARPTPPRRRPSARPERAPGVEPFQEHGTRAGVRRQQRDGAPPVPQFQRMPLHPGFVVGEGDLQGSRGAVLPGRTGTTTPPWPFQGTAPGPRSGTSRHRASRPRRGRAGSQPGPAAAGAGVAR